MHDRGTRGDVPGVGSLARVARGPVRQVAAVVGAVLVALGLLSVLGAVSGPNGPFGAGEVGPAVARPTPEGTGDAPGHATSGDAAADLAAELDLSYLEVAPVLGAWVSARVVDGDGGGVWVQVAPSKGALPDGTLVHATVSEVVPVGARIHVQAWAVVTVERAPSPMGPVKLSVEPDPVDADNPDGTVVAGFEPGTTTYDGALITVGRCVGERAVDLRVETDDGLFAGREQARPGDAWDVPRWHLLTVLGVDNAYADDGCRVIVELAPAGA